MSMMKLNARSPVVWDWENLIVFPSRAVTKTTSLVGSEIEATSGFEAGSLHSSGGGSGGSATLETSHSVSQDHSCRKELVGAWPARAPSMTDISTSRGSGESLIGLKLGKRTYFEAVTGGSNTSKTAESPASSNATVKRSKSSSQITEFPRCQVFGCNLDLSSAKVYHRKHRVCETHTKSSKVIIRGLEHRFCQQCSRFHSLSEFDQKKRSCRRRLSDHNARRRKPKPEIIEFSSVTLHSSLHDGRNQINYAFNRVPLVQTRPDSSTKLIQGRVGLCSPMKTACSDELQATWNKPQETGFKVSYGSAQPSRFKEAPTDAIAFHQGLQASATGNSMDAVQAHSTTAVSLLSTNSWGSGVLDTTPPPLQNHHHHHHIRSLGLPAVSTDYWEQSSHHRALSLLSGNSSLDESGMIPHHQYRPLGLPTVSGDVAYDC